ncbi:MAG: hypothetical protein JNM69_29380 [Archangium sp.]|nr:hypothetical protein [Archangium sp.]
MPIETSELKTRSGHLVLRVVFSGDVTVAQAKAYHSSVLPGAQYGLHGHLALGNVTGLSSARRRPTRRTRCPSPSSWSRRCCA